MKAVKLTLRALIMIMIFAGSIFGRAWVYSHSHLDSILTQHVTSIKRIDDSKSKTPSDCTLNRIFKSKRRIEKYGFVQKALSSTLPQIFYSTVAILDSREIQKPSPAEIFLRPQPPRQSSTI